MSQQAAVTLNTKVYNPAGSDKGIVKWVDRSGGFGTSFSPLTQGFLENQTSRKLTKVSYRVAIPVIATTDSDCSCSGTVLRTSSVQIEFWIAPDSTAAEREDLYLRVKDLISSTLVASGVKNLDPAYG